MKTVAVVCNILFWVFLCMVLVTDGPPEGSGILISLATFLLPIFNVLVIRFLSSPGHTLLLAAFILNILWIALAGWMIASRYPSHPAEEGVLEFVVITAVTPLVTAVAIFLRLKGSHSLATR